MQTRSDNISETETAFAPTPVWDRGSKRSKSLLGARKTVTPRVETPIETHIGETRVETVTAEPRSFAAETTPIVTRTVERVTPARTVTAIDESPAPLHDEDTRGLAGGAAFAGTPVYATGARRTASARKSGVSGAAIAAGVAVVGVIAAGAWYMSQPRGVETITPSAPVQTAAVTPAPVPAAPLVAPVETAQATAPASMAMAAPEPVRVARARPAASAASADEMGVNTSATLPASPIPYGEIPQVATGGTVAPAPVPASSAPATMTPIAPAPVAAAPATVAPAQPTPVNPTPEATAQPGADMTSNPTP